MLLLQWKREDIAWHLLCLLTVATNKGKHWNIIHMYVFGFQSPADLTKRTFSYIRLDETIVIEYDVVNFACITIFDSQKILKFQK